MAVAMQYGSRGSSNGNSTQGVIYEGIINDGSTLTFELDAGKMYEIFTAEYNASTDVYRGHRARLVKMPEASLYGTVAAATVNEAASSNSGVTITMNADSTISIASSSSTYAVKYVIRAVDVRTGSAITINGGGGGGGSGTLTQVTFDGVVYTDDGTGNVTFDESDPVFLASDAYSITSTDITNWNNKVDSASLATVATSGDYTDLSNTPSLATVATSGSYNDLSDTPTIHNVPSGGSTGQVLAKSSGTDYDVGWVNQSGGGGGGSGVSMTLLWTNPDPSSSFSAQTVLLDLSGYDAIIVNMKLTAASTTYGNSLCLIGQKTTALAVTNESTYTYKRYVTPTSSGVEFSAGYRNTTSGAFAIPLYIYGISGIT